MVSLKSKSPYDQSYFLERKGPLLELKAIIYSLLVKLILHPQRLLDVGCAEGYFVKWANRWGVDAFGADLSAEAISLVPAEIKHKCYVANLMVLPFPKKHFQVVASLATLEHISKDKTEKALKELIRVASDYVLLQICVKDNPLEKNNYLRDPTHVNVETSDWWMKKMSQLELRLKFAIPRIGIFLIMV